ncbi:pilus assembly protein PilM [Puniceicoccaceae bacterium K14]|nr:pilus assembly protein PilM [Puniceicoccaceae bacterium K14]
MADNLSALSQKEIQMLVPLDSDVVSGHLFFCRRIELPEGLENSEIAGVIELELDKLSPFPVEHLHFGYLVDVAMKYAWVYASYKKRVENERAKKWESLDWATTDYAIGLVAESSSKSPLVLVTPDSLVCLQFDELSELPSSFRAKTRLLGEDDPSMDDQIASFATELGIRPSYRTWEVAPQINQTGQTLVLEATDRSSGAQICQRVLRSRSWSMDIRDSAVISKVQNEERRNYVLWKVVLGVMILLALLIVGELAFGGAVGYRNMREEWNANNEPQVEEILSMQSTIAELNNFKESDLVPFEMLAAINPYLDKNDNLLTRVETDGPNALIVDGEANNISARNSYKSRLEGFGKVEGVEILSSRTTQRGTEYSLRILFREGQITR